MAQAAAAADNQYGSGVTDIEIQIGRTSAYSGPVWAYSTFSKTEVAYVRMINEPGGINGRNINLISLDDGYSPPKTVEPTRRLVEQDHVLGIFHSLGTTPNAAIQDYLNEMRVPHCGFRFNPAVYSDAKPATVARGSRPAFRFEAGRLDKHTRATPTGQPLRHQQSPSVDGEDGIPARRELTMRQLRQMLQLGGGAPVRAALLQR